MKFLRKILDKQARWFEEGGPLEKFYPLWEANDTFLYTPGNHDWEYPGQPWNDATREAYYPRFAGLTNGSPAQQVVVVGGVRLIGIDNSNYQVTTEQVAFVAEQLATGDPCLRGSTSTGSRPATSAGSRR